MYRNRSISIEWLNAIVCVRVSRWIGESERQLKLLFEQASQKQPSIIFFDEIDGLAPVRSSKTDQIHNSIVSTLLAEMDGLKDRGDVIVIGATNRVDSLDPALRRPGRFDHEFQFFLPSYAVSSAIWFDIIIIFYDTSYFLFPYHLITPVHNK